MMSRSKCLGVTVFAALFMAVAPGAHAAKGGNGGGKGSGGGNSTQPVAVTFRDCTGGVPSGAFVNLHPNDTAICQSSSDDRLKSDEALAYTDGLDGVGAFIALTGSYGALGVRLAQSPRGLFIDFSDCAGALGSCNPPFTSQIDSSTAIDVDADKVVQNGLLGMTVGQSISTPLRVTYGDFGFINFNPNVKGKDPCKNKSNYVVATRTSDTTWEVIADANTIGCMTLPGGDFGGTYRMPFQFTIVQQ